MTLDHPFLVIGKKRPSPIITSSFHFKLFICENQKNYFYERKIELNRKVGGFLLRELY